MTTRSVSHADWKAEAESRFGKDPLKWRFVCPSCRHVASVDDWRQAGADEGEVAFNCVGRRSKEQRATADAAFRGKGGPCNYTGGGLFKLNPVLVDFGDGKPPRPTFEFADAEQPAAEQPEEGEAHV